MEGWSQYIVIRILSRIYDPEAGRRLAQVIDFSLVYARWNEPRIHGTHAIIILNNLYILSQFIRGRRINEYISLDPGESTGDQWEQTGGRWITEQANQLVQHPFSTVTPFFLPLSISINSPLERIRLRPGHWLTGLSRCGPRFFNLSSFGDNAEMGTTRIESHLRVSRMNFRFHKRDLWRPIYLKIGTNKI